jgi:hypothetical protein
VLRVYILDCCSVLLPELELPVWVLPETDLLEHMFQLRIESVFKMLLVSST